MQIQFDGKPHTIRVNLIDRSHFSTPMLLGRKALKKLNAVVDSTKKNTLLHETDSQTPAGLRFHYWAKQEASTFLCPLQLLKSGKSSGKQNGFESIPVKTTPDPTAG